MSLPDPNMFAGPTAVIRGGDILARVDGKPVDEAVAAFYDPDVMSLFTPAAIPFPYEDNARGLGVVDMVHAIAAGRPHRADGDLAMHVLEALIGFERAAEQEGAYVMHTTCERPAALRENLAPGELD